MNNKHHKFVLRDNVTEFIEKSVGSLNEKRQDLCSSFHPSWFRECNRKIIYRTKDYFLSDSFLEKQNSKLLRDKWLDIFSKCKGVRLAEKSVVAADKNYKIAGEVDAVIEVNNLIMPVIIKKSNIDSLKTVVKQGAFSKDVIELVIYLWLFELESGIIIYDSIGSGEFYTFHIKIYKPIVESVKSKCLNLIQFQNTNKLPERAYEDRDTRECTECEFDKQCWGGKDDK